ncbi:MAG TPA: AAA family ATPase, partial [Nitrososphaera sp.]|nr:AAA family ATPase [Nitrososphaera sp.]
SHALMLTGAPGSGKASLAKAICARLLELDGVESLESYPYFEHLAKPDGKQDIPIEEVRRVRRLLELKVPGKKAVRRVILIEDAHNLSSPAQNAILKTLEEPAHDTVFILGANSSGSVLPTIASRAQQINVRPAGLKAAKSYFDAYSEEVVESAWRLSRGRPGLLAALLADDSGHPLKGAIDEAKKFLGCSSYERFLEIDRLAADKYSLSVFLEALERALAALHRGALNAGRTTQSAKLLAARRLTNKSLSALADNANAKLILLNLVLNLDL